MKQEKTPFLRYLARYLFMKHIRQKTEEVNFSASEEMVTYSRSFKEFKRNIEEKGILLGDIYNMNSIGFRIGVGGNQWVVTMDIERPHYNHQILIVMMPRLLRLLLKVSAISRSGIPRQAFLITT